MNLKTLYQQNFVKISVSQENSLLIQEWFSFRQTEEFKKAIDETVKIYRFRSNQVF
jgi:hypothetical protein